MSGAGAAIFKVGTFCLHFLAQSTKSPLFPINVGQLRKRKRVLCWSIYIIGLGPALFAGGGRLATRTRCVRSFHRAHRFDECLHI